MEILWKLLNLRIIRSWSPVNFILNFYPALKNHILYLKHFYKRFNWITALLICGKLFFSSEINCNSAKTLPSNKGGYNPSSSSSPVGRYKKTTPNPLTITPTVDSTPVINVNKKPFFREKIINPAKNFLSKSWQTVKEKFGFKKRKKSESETKINSSTDVNPSQPDIPATKKALKVLQETEKLLVESPESNVSNATNPTLPETKEPTAAIKPTNTLLQSIDPKLKKEIRESLLKTSSGEPEIASLEKQISENQLDPRVQQAKQQLVNELEEALKVRKQEEEKKLKLAQEVTDKNLYKELSEKYLDSDGNLKPEIENWGKNQEELNAKLYKELTQLKRQKTEEKLNEQIDEQIDEIKNLINTLKNTMTTYTKLLYKKPKEGYSLRDLQFLQKIEPQITKVNHSEPSNKQQKKSLKQDLRSSSKDLS